MTIRKFHMACLFVLIVLFFAQAGLAAGAVKRTAYAPFLPEPENFDGKIEEESWTKAAVIKDFYNLEGTALAKVQTEVRLIAAPEALWVGVRAFEPYMDKIKMTQRRDGDSIWNDDSVELFFVLSDDIYELRQFIISAGGLRYMGYGRGTSVRPADYPNWEVAVSRGEKEWTAEIIIPYHALGLKSAPKLGDTLSFNVARTRYPEGKEYSSWSILDGANFHEKSKYGFLKFELQTEEKTDVIASANIKTEMRMLSEEHPGEIFLVRTVAPTADFSGFPLSFSGGMAEEIRISAAINEYTSLPIVITNLTDAAETYRVIIFGGEVKGIEQEGLVESVSNNLFPGDAIIMREAVRVKESDAQGSGLRYDPLPLMNEGNTITVLPGDSGVVWVTFDCRSAKPGTYSGTLRVIPLSQPAEFKGNNYQGPMKDIPLYLEVWPIELAEETPIPLCLFHKADNEHFFADMFEHGVRYFQINTWALTMDFNDDGTLKEPVNMPTFHKYVNDNLSWFPEDSKAKLWIGYSAYDIFEREHSGRRFTLGSDAWKTAWSSFLQKLDEVLRNEYGLTNDDYIVELFDEPILSSSSTKVRFVAKTAKEAVPNLKTQITLARAAENYIYEDLAPYIDSWCIKNVLWDDPQTAAYFKNLAEQGKEVWIYSCESNMTESLYGYYRLHAWKAYAYGLDGMGMWEYIDGPGGLYGAASWKKAATGPLVYRSFDIPIPSIRYECLREGINDIRYLSKLETLVILAKERGINNVLVQNAETLLAEEPKNVIEQTDDETRAESIRQQAAAYIMQLQALLN